MYLLELFEALSIHMLHYRQNNDLVMESEALAIQLVRWLINGVTVQEMNDSCLQSSGKVFDHV